MILSVDVETGGLNPFTDALLSLGIVAYDDQWKPLGEFYQQRKPKSDEMVWPQALEVNGLNPQMGLGHKEFCNELRAFFTSLGEETKFPLGHNGAGFDAGFLKHRLGEVWTTHVHYRWRDTMVLANALVDAGKIAHGHHRGLKSLCSRYRIPYGNHHALEDARCTALLYRAMLSEI